MAMMQLAALRDVKSHDAAWSPSPDGTTRVYGGVERVPRTPLEWVLPSIEQRDPNTVIEEDDDDEDSGEEDGAGGEGGGGEGAEGADGGGKDGGEDGGADGGEGGATSRRQRSGSENWRLARRGALQAEGMEERIESEFEGLMRYAQRGERHAMRSAIGCNACNGCNECNGCNAMRSAIGVGRGRERGRRRRRGSEAARGGG